MGSIISIWYMRDPGIGWPRHWTKHSFGAKWANILPTKACTLCSLAPDSNTCSPPNCPPLVRLKYECSWTCLVFVFWSMFWIRQLRLCRMCIYIYIHIIYAYIYIYIQCYNIYIYIPYDSWVLAGAFCTSTSMQRGKPIEREGERDRARARATAVYMYVCVSFKQIQKKWRQEGCRTFNGQGSTQNDW